MPTHSPAADRAALVSAGDPLSASRIAAALEPALRMRIGDLAVHQQLDSTNSELQRRVAHDARDLLVCLADIQTSGRGRRGRAWYTPLGSGIAFSLLKRFDGGMNVLAGLSLVAGIATLDALADLGVRDVGLKWPNDLVADGRKLGGILVEIGGSATASCHAVIGIGLNVRLDAQAGAAIDQPWTDLATLNENAAADRNAIAARLVTRLVAALDRFTRAGFASFAGDYARHDVLRGQRIHVLQGNVTRTGTALGVDARGALRVACADGEYALDSGEVSVRRAP
ncbi:MAG: biotin--[acetyl-CoA-carboxylase] ligase [Rhodanobacter sp.]|jgi:BirA family biotin operon repressor/biotin-[acetyl-CoA-carboxylase] ligase|nr:biotin--[acetyl-CoA-carboxylase] ligase [Rhodanobacter sp.]